MSVFDVDAHGPYLRSNCVFNPKRFIRRTLHPKVDSDCRDVGHDRCHLIEVYSFVTASQDVKNP